MWVISTVWQLCFRITLVHFPLRLHFFNLAYFFLLQNKTYNDVTRMHPYENNAIVIQPYMIHL